jgi:hypothetical protein
MKLFTISTVLFVLVSCANHNFKRHPADTKDTLTVKGIIIDVFKRPIENTSISVYEMDLEKKEMILINYIERNQKFAGQATEKDGSFEINYIPSNKNIYLKILKVGHPEKWIKVETEEATTKQATTILLTRKYSLDKYHMEKNKQVCTDVANNLFNKGNVLKEAEASKLIEKTFSEFQEANTSYSFCSCVAKEFINLIIESKEPHSQSLLKAALVSPPSILNKYRYPGESLELEQKIFSHNFDNFKLEDLHSGVFNINEKRERVDQTIVQLLASRVQAYDPIDRIEITEKIMKSLEGDNYRDLQEGFIKAMAESTQKIKINN